VNILGRSCRRALTILGLNTAPLRRAVALVDSNFRALFSLSGPDRQRYLNAVLTSNVRDLKAGQGTVGLLLTPQGHILAEVETLALADRILAFSHAMVRDRTFSTLDKFIIMDDVTLEDWTPSTGTLDLLGPRAAELISALAKVDIAAMPEAAHVEAKLGSIPCRIVRHTWVGHPAATLVVAREQLSVLWQELAPPASERTEVCPPEWKPSIRFVWSPGLRGLDRITTTRISLTRQALNSHTLVMRKAVTRVRKSWSESAHAGMQTGGSPGCSFSTGKRPQRGRSCSFPGILPEKKPAKSPARVFSLGWPANWIGLRAARTFRSWNATRCFRQHSRSDFASFAGKTILRLKSSPLAAAIFVLLSSKCHPCRGFW